jgi:hypothetical protein
MSEDILARLAKDPEYLTKVLNSSRLAAFKDGYRVERSTGLKCPACSNYFTTGGSLWGPVEGTTDMYVCRKCLLVWQIRCSTRSIDSIITEVKEAQEVRRNSK